MEIEEKPIMEETNLENIKKEEDKQPQEPDEKEAEEKEEKKIISNQEIKEGTPSPEEQLQMKEAEEQLKEVDKILATAEIQNIHSYQRSTKIAKEGEKPTEENVVIISNENIEIEVNEKILSDSDEDIPVNETALQKKESGLSKITTRVKKHTNLFVKSVKKIVDQTNRREDYLENGEQIDPNDPELKDSKVVDMRDEEDVQEENSGLNIRLLTYNFFLRPPLINNNGNDYKNLRLKLFCTTELRKYDIINFQEVFKTFNDKRKRLIKAAVHCGMIHVSLPPKHPFLSKFLIDSGLLTVSRFKIVKQDFKNFKFCSGVDALAFKGVLYSKIDIGMGKYIHLFNLHTQATYSSTYDKKSKDQYKARLDQLIIARNVMEYFLKQNSTISYGAHLFKDLILMAGDFNVDSHRKALPAEVFKKLHDKRAQDWLESVEDEKDLTEYNFLLHVLSGFGKDKVVDFVKEAYGGQHPNTYGDSFREEVVEENGMRVDYHPRETILTCNSDFNTQQCLDYIFQILPEKNEKMKIKGSCKVRPFFVEKSVITQLSDHYGIELSFNVGQFNEIDE